MKTKIRVYRVTSTERNVTFQGYGEIQYLCWHLFVRAIRTNVWKYSEIRFGRPASRKEGSTHSRCLRGRALKGKEKRRKGKEKKKKSFPFSRANTKANAQHEPRCCKTICRGYGKQWTITRMDVEGSKVVGGDESMGKGSCNSFHKPLILRWLEQPSVSFPPHLIPPTMPRFDPRDLWRITFLSGLRKTGVFTILSLFLHSRNQRQDFRGKGQSLCLLAFTAPGNWIKETIWG